MHVNVVWPYNFWLNSLGNVIKSTPKANFQSHSCSLKVVEGSSFHFIYFLMKNHNKTLPLLRHQSAVCIREIRIFSFYFCQRFTKLTMDKSTRVNEVHWFNNTWYVPIFSQSICWWIMQWIIIGFNFSCRLTFLQAL